MREFVDYFLRNALFGRFQLSSSFSKVLRRKRAGRSYYYGGHPLEA